MAAGYSGTPLVRKLGIEAGMRCAVVDPPEYYRELLVGLPDDLAVVGASAADLDFVHLFVRGQRDLGTRLSRLRNTIAQDGVIRVSWPKKASGVQTDLTGNVVREAAFRRDSST